MVAMEACYIVSDKGSSRPQSFDLGNAALEGWISICDFLEERNGGGVVHGQKCDPSRLRKESLGRRVDDLEQIEKERVKGEANEKEEQQPESPSAGCPPDESWLVGGGVVAGPSFLGWTHLSQYRTIRP